MRVLWVTFRLGVVLGTALSVLGVSGCGQKGALYLTASSAASSSSTNAR